MWTAHRSMSCPPYLTSYRMRGNRRNGGNISSDGSTCASKSLSSLCVLSCVFQHWRQEKGYDLYPVLRLILPQKDRERAVYGLKEKNLATIYIKLIPLRRDDADAIRMLNWKKPTERNVSCTRCDNRRSSSLRIP